MAAFTAFRDNSLVGKVLSKNMGGTGKKKPRTAGKDEPLAGGSNGRPGRRLMSRRPTP